MHKSSYLSWNRCRQWRIILYATVYWKIVAYIDKWRVVCPFLFLRGAVFTVVLIFRQACLRSRMASPTGSRIGYYMDGSLGRHCFTNFLDRLVDWIEPAVPIYCPNGKAFGITDQLGRCDITRAATAIECLSGGIPDGYVLEKYVFATYGYSVTITQSQYW